MSQDNNRKKISQFLPDDWGLLLSAFGAAYGVGFLTLFALPFLIGAAMSSLSISAVQAAFLGTGEFVGVMISSMVLAPFIAKFDRRRVVYFGVVIVFTVNVACIFINSYELMALLRPIAGIGTGLVMACGNATVANSKNPERFAAHMTVLTVALIFVVALIFSRLSELWGLAGIYAAMAVIVALMSLLFAKMPSHAISWESTSDSQNSTRGIISTVGLLTLAAFFVFSLRDTMVWGFLEQIGSEVGYSVAEVGNVLSAQAVVGIFGPIAASIIGSRFGLKLPLAVGIFVSGLVTYVVSQSSESQLMYTAAVMFMPGSYFFTLSYLTALAAELDDKGRIVAASGSALMAGIAIGPVVGGQLVDLSGGYKLVGWAIMLCLVFTFLFVLRPLSVANKEKPLQYA